MGRVDPFARTKRQRRADKNAKKQEGELYQQFEQEFARPLSPIEAETLSMWLDEDKHSAELISAALREAVVSGKLNFRYIDRILFEWKRNSIKTVEEAKAHSERFRKKARLNHEEKRPIRKTFLVFIGSKIYKEFRDVVKKRYTICN